MSHIRTDFLDDLQDMLHWPLVADVGYFSVIPVFGYRANINAEEVERALTMYKGKGGKIGAAVVVMPIAAGPRFVEASPQHPYQARISYRVLTYPMFNQGVQGTMRRSLSICTRICQVMMHYIFDGFSTPLSVPSGEPNIVPVEDQVAPEAREVFFDALVGVDQNFVKVENPVIDYNDVTGVATISCPTPDVTIYYTLDGSYPWTDANNPNPSAILYTGPITLEGEWILMTAAWKEVYMISNVKMLRSSQIGDQGAGGEPLGTIS